jgi:hypothetical protein
MSGDIDERYMQAGFDFPSRMHIPPHQNVQA